MITEMHNGQIMTVKDKSGNTKYLAVSNLETETDHAPFNLFSTAAWYLSIIKDRHDAKNFRLGLTI